MSEMNVLLKIHHSMAIHRHVEHKLYFKLSYIKSYIMLNDL